MSHTWHLVVTLCWKKNLEVLLMNYHLIRMARYHGVYMKCLPSPTSSQTRTQLLSEGYGEVTGSSLISGLIPWWIQGLMALLGSGGGGLAGRPLRRVYMRALFCPGPFCIPLSVLPVYNEGNDSSSFPHAATAVSNTNHNNQWTNIYQPTFECNWFVGLLSVSNLDCTDIWLCSSQEKSWNNIC